MKKMILMFAVLLIGTASSAYSTPVVNFDANADDNAFFNDVGRVEFTRIADVTGLPGNFAIGTRVAAIDTKDFSSFLSRWMPPSWFKRPSGSGIGMRTGSYLDHPYFPREQPPIDGEIPGGDTPNPVPEPATMLLFGTGLLGLAMVARKERKR